MRWVHRLFAALAILAVAGAPATAQLYFEINGMGTVLQDPDNDFALIGGGMATVEADTDFGGGVSGAVGYAFNNFRVEGELSYRQNGVDDLVNGNTPFLLTSGAFAGVVFPAGQSLSAAGVSVDGDISSLAFMANGWYDIDTGTPFTPYVGGGIGGAIVSLNSIEISAPGVGTQELVDDSDFVFAYQIGAGVAYEITPRFTVSAGYRLLGTSDPELDSGGTTIESEYLSHNFTVGLRITL